MIFIWLSVIAVAVFADQLTKWLAVMFVKGAGSIEVIPWFIDFSYVENRGAAWGMFSEHRWVFLVITSIALIAMPYFLFKYRKEHFLFGFSLSLVISGAIGNMIDRVFLGYVVDFLEAAFISFPVFNFADCCVTVGAALLFVYFVFLDKTILVFDEKDKKKDKSNDSTEPEVTVKEDE